jgi:Fic family protein
MKEVLFGGKKPEKREEVEAYNYFRTINFFYGLAWEQYKAREFEFSHALIRQTAKFVAEQKDYRVKDVHVSGANLKPPKALLVKNWIDYYVDLVKNGFYRPSTEEEFEDFITFIAIHHVLFESIYPFEDGNGRVGRIVTNYLLISSGMPPVIIKGLKDKDRDTYIKALEDADKPLMKLTSKEVFDKGEVETALREVKELL